MFSKNDSEQAIWLEYDGNKNENKIPDPEEIGISLLKEDGDFRSKECVDLPKQVGIVCINFPKEQNLVRASIKSRDQEFGILEHYPLAAANLKN